MVASIVTFFNIFVLFNLSNSYDYLRITDDSGNTIGTYCGNQTGKSVRVFGTAAVLTFHTDGSVQSRGYELHFSFFSKSVGEFRTMSTVFTALMNCCYSTQPLAAGFVSRAHGHERIQSG